MALDLMTRFYTCLNYPLLDKLKALTTIIDQSSPSKDLQAIFPQLINNIFASSFSNGWGLRSASWDTDRYEYELLISFLEPQGPMFRLCYKLLLDPQLKYHLPLSSLPMELQLTLERGRCPQFYMDMLTTDPQSLNAVALALNPFDFYIFNFALHLVSYSPNKSSWENCAYFALACDYLMHFLPSDPNVPVLPHIPNYSGKVHMAAPLQTANRPFSQHSPSLLILPDLPGISNQHTPPQNQTKNEVWRSETVLQVFIDVWMSVDQFNARNIEMYQKNYINAYSSPERVRTVRVLVKHIHSFSAKHISDPAGRSDGLRTYARQLMCARAYHYIKHMVSTWPLDASFRLVMELWLSLIQPWRYTDNAINQDRFPQANNNQQEEGSTHAALDASFTQYIAENFPAYTCILQLVLPRISLDLRPLVNRRNELSCVNNGHVLRVSEAMANVNVSEKPAHEIFQELLIIKQKDNEPIDTFIAKKKALFAQLPYNLLESQKLDMIYSTLNDKIQEMVPRDAVQTFDELLEAAKPTQPKKRMRCNFCRHAGHTADECRKKAAPALRLDTVRRSTIKFQIDNIIDEGIVGSAAQACVASYSLYTKLKARGYRFTQCHDLVNGTEMDFLKVNCNVKFGDRTLPMEFVVFPENREAECLLGRPLLSHITVHFGEDIWYFHDQPSKIYPLLKEKPRNDNVFRIGYLHFGPNS